MTGKNTEQHLANAIKHSFEQSVDHLDAATLSRLNVIRHAALQRSESFYTPLFKWAFAPLIVTACMAVMIFSFIKTDPATAPFKSEDIEMLSTAEELEMYEDLEFYQWLGDYEISA